MGGKNQGLGSSNSCEQPNFWRTRSIEVHTFKPYLLGLGSHLSSNIYIYVHPIHTQCFLLWYLCFIISLLSGVSLRFMLILALYLTNKTD